MFPKKKLTGLLVGATLAGLASTSVSASLLSSLTAIFGSSVTIFSLFPPTRTCDKSIVWKITNAIPATLGAIGTYKAASVFSREPFPLMP